MEELAGWISVRGLEPANVAMGVTLTNEIITGPEGGR